MKPAATLLLALALTATVVQAASFKDLCDQFEPLRKISDLKYVKPEIKVTAKTEGVKPQDVVFTIDARRGRSRYRPARTAGSSCR